jgi:hypothetical protein
MNRRQWFAVWELDSAQCFLEGKTHPVYGLPKPTVKPAGKLPLAMIPRPLLAAP